MIGKNGRAYQRKIMSFRQLNYHTPITGPYINVAV